MALGTLTRRILKISFSVSEWFGGIPVIKGELHLLIWPRFLACSSNAGCHDRSQLGVGLGV